MLSSPPLTSANLTSAYSTFPCISSISSPDTKERGNYNLTSSPHQSSSDPKESQPDPSHTNQTQTEKGNASPSPVNHCCPDVRRLKGTRRGRQVEQMKGLAMCLPDANDASTRSISIIYAVLGVRCPVITVNHRPCENRAANIKQIGGVAWRGGRRAGQTPCISRTSIWKGAEARGDD